MPIHAFPRWRPPASGLRWRGEDALSTPASPDSAAAEPSAALDTRDAVGIIVGIVVGSGIFTVPSLVARQVGDPGVALALWLAGGVLSVIGGLCYAELASSYPSAGGDYAFLKRAYGKDLAFLYGWARMAVITTGSIAFLAFAFGDYMTEVLPLGAYSSPLYAVLCIALLTALNLAGIRQGTTAQNLFTLVEVLGVVAIAVVGLWVVAPAEPAAVAVPESTPSIGLAMVFVLYAYGGWNEAAYVSAELRRPRSMALALGVSLAGVTALYALANLAYVRGLSLRGMAESDALAADLLARAFGEPARAVVSVMIALAALTSANATVIVGARSDFALGRDFSVFAALGRWDRARGTPTAGLVVQGLLATALVVLGAATRQGLQTMIDYTAPVFWLFFLLVGVGLFVMRVRDPARPRPFGVPLYPITPLCFCATCGYLLYSSLSYARTGAIVGVGVLVLGSSPLAWSHGRRGLALLCALAGLSILALAAGARVGA